MARPFFKTAAPKSPPIIPALANKARRAIKSFALPGIAFAVLLLLQGGRQQHSDQAFGTPLPIRKASKNTASWADIVKLFKQLGNSDSHKAARAYSNLLKIGPPVLQGQWQAWEWVGNNSNAFQSHLQVISKIQARHGIQPVRVNGLEFLPITDLVWRKPPPGKSQQIKLEIKVTNYAKKATGILLLTDDWFELHGHNYQRLERGGGTDHFPVGAFTKLPALPKGRSFTVTCPIATLSTSKNGKDLLLQGQDNCSFFYYNGLKPGLYFISFEIPIYCQPADDGKPLLMGIALPFPIAIEIRERKECHAQTG
jgi:hypothetical protein